MILWLRRKMGLMARDEGGQSLVFVAMCLFMMFLFVCVTADVGDFVAQKIDAQNSADAMAASTAVWQARGLNLVQTLNVAKNLAHMHFMLEIAEALYWAVRAAASCASWNVFECAYDLWQLQKAVGPGPCPWLCWWDESMFWEKDNLENELEQLTEIQGYIAGVDPSSSDEGGEWGSTEQAMAIAIPMIDLANKGDFTSVAANYAMARWEVLPFPNPVGLYDPDLKIEFQRRASFMTIFSFIFELIGDPPDDWGDAGEFLDWIDDISTLVEVDFPWAIQTEEYIEEQFTIGLAVRDAKGGPLFTGRFEPRTLVGDLFGFGSDVHLAIAQAKPFKPDPYVLGPRFFRNGMGAQLLALPFDLSALIGNGPSGIVSAIWDVKLTPVTVLEDLSPALAPVSDLVMTH